MKKRIRAAALAAMAIFLGTAAPALAVSVEKSSAPQVLTRAYEMPLGLAADSTGTVYMAVGSDSQIISLSGGTKVFAGIKTPRDQYNRSAGGYGDGDLSKAAFWQPQALAALSGGLLVADTNNHTIRLIQNGEVYTFAGSPKKGYQDGPRDQALFNCPGGVTTDEAGNVYVADTANQVIRKIDGNGTVTTVAGSPGQAGFSNGAAGTARLCDPMGLAYYGGALYIADSGNQRIRKLENGVVSTVAGGGSEKFPGVPFIVGDYVDGAPMVARFNSPENITFDEKGNLYIADTGNGMVRVLENGSVKTLVGAGGDAAEKYLAEPYGLLIQNDKLMISDRFTGYVIAVSIGV